MRLHGCSEQRNDSCEPASVQVCPAQRWFIAHGVVHRAMPQLVKPWPPHAVPASADGSSRQLSRVRAFCATGPRKLECQGLLAHPPPQFSAVSYWPVTSLGFGICAFGDALLLTFASSWDCLPPSHSRRTSTHIWCDSYIWYDADVGFCWSTFEIPGAYFPASSSSFLLTVGLHLCLQPRLARVSYSGRWFNKEERTHTSMYM